MIYCLNPDCKQPINLAEASLCAHCNSPLTPLLRGRYRIQKQLGRGGFGKTFLAIDEDRLNAPCVIKQFSPQAKGTDAMEKAVRLFEQEARRLDELGEHPQIPTLLAYFEYDQRLYLVQQFVEGQTLVQELADQGVFPEQKIREVLVGILPILKFVHDRNVIHRDITPANIIRRESDGKLVLIDFGVAKLLNESTLGLPGTKIGTEGYAPIEQLRSGKAYPASDLYSLGVTCLYLVTQTKPEELYDPLRGRWQWQERLTELNLAVSNGVADMLDVMVRDLVPERFQTAAAAIEVLLAALKHPPLGLPVGAPIPQPPPLSPSRPMPLTGELPPPRSRIPMPEKDKDDVTAIQIKAPPTIAAPPTSKPLQSQPLSAQRVSGMPNTGSDRPITSQPTTAQPTTNKPITGQPTTKQPITGQLTTGGLTNPRSALGQVDYPCLARLKGHSSWVLALAISPDSRFLASAGLDDRIIIWDITTGQARFTINDAHNKPINSLAISPDGQWLASASDDDTIKIWQLATGQLTKVLAGHTQDVNAVMFTPDGQFIVSGSEDRTVSVWRWATGERLRNFPEVSGLVKVTAVSANGEFAAAGGSDSVIKVWNLNGGHLVQTLKGHLNAVQALAISSEGRFVVSGSKDRTIRIWILKTGEMVRALVKHLDAINGVVISPDSRVIISGSADKTVRVWRLPTGEPLATLNQHTGAVNAIAVSNNQRWFASGSADGQICIWQLTPKGSGGSMDLG